MRRIVFALLIAGAVQAAVPQEEKPAGAPPEMTDPKTPEHKHLAKLAGEWDIKLTMHMGPKPETVTAVGSDKLALGGLCVVTQVTGQMGPSTFEGKGIAGYDRHAKEFVGVWVDTESNKPSFSRGSYDEKTQTLTMTGEMNTPQGPLTTKTVAVLKDDNTRTENVYAKGPDGKEQLLMEFVYTRRKDAAPLKPATVSMENLNDDLEKTVGKWNTLMKITPGDPTMGESKGTETVTPICGGKWVWVDLSSDLGGTKFNAYSIQGYDPETKKFKAVWCDNFGGTFDVAEGTSDGKVRSMEGTTYDREGKKTTWTEKMTWKDADTRATNWVVGDMQVDVNYTRAK